jgi:hypothetical protein
MHRFRRFLLSILLVGVLLKADLPASPIQVRHPQGSAQALWL